MFSLEPSDTPIEIENLIDEELEQAQEFTKKNSEKINEYESLLLKKLQNFQKPTQKELYNKTINEISEYLESFKSKDSFIINIISYLKLADLEELYINGILDSNNNRILESSISKLLNERLRIFNHLELAKTLISILSSDSNNTTYLRNTKISYIFKTQFEAIINSERIKHQDIKTLNLGLKKQAKTPDTTKNDIKDKIESIVVSPKEEVKKRQAGPKRTGIQVTGRGLGNRRPAKKVTISKEEKNRQLAETKARQIAEENKRLLIQREAAENNRQLFLELEKRKLETNKPEINNIDRPIEEIKKVRVKKAEKIIIEDSFFLNFGDKITDEQSKIFFEKLNAFRKSRRTDKSILSDKTYISFIEKASEEVFFKILDIEQLTINGDKLDNKIVLQIFKRLISFSKEKLVELDRFKGHKKRINTIKSKLNGLVKEELENAYEIHLNDIETTNIVKVPKTKEEKIIIEDNFFLNFGDKITDDQSKIFFEKLNAFRKSRRTDKSILSNKTYISFVEKASEEDLYKLLDIEAISISKNVINIKILEAFFKKLLKAEISTGNEKHILKRVNNIRDKILENTKLVKLSPELETDYNVFEELHKKNKSELNLVANIKKIKKEIKDLIDDGDIEEAIEKLEKNRKLLSKKDSGIQVETLEKIIASSIEEVENILTNNPEIESNTVTNNPELEGNIGKISQEEYENLKDEIRSLIEAGDEKRAIEKLEQNIELFAVDRITKILIRLKDKEILRNFIMKHNIGN